MRTLTYPSPKFGQITLEIHAHTLHIYVGAANHFYAHYANMPIEYNLEEVEDGYFHLMMYVLFIDLENIDISGVQINTSGHKKLLAYSGGADSTAVLVQYPCIPVHIYRDWALQYEERQYRAVRNVRGIDIVTNVEHVRRLYDLKQGFNIGIGYGSMFLPIMPVLGADTVYFGIIFDDISFFYGKPFAYNSDFTKSRSFKLIETLQKHGIKFEMPLAGYSEVLSTRIADAGHIQNFSSCNVEGATDKCLNCYKCFRKEAIRGNALNIEYNSELYRKMVRIFSAYPLKMASSMIYGIQRTYGWPEFDIDVSFLERVNPTAHNTFYGGDLLPGFEFQTVKDMDNIHKFVDFINGYENGFKI